MLEKVTGPDCPRCGCQDSRVLRESMRWGRVHQRRVCGNCRMIFSATPEPDRVDDANDSGSSYGVIYHILRCPHCDSDQVKTTSTQRPVRYHKCMSCGGNFKSTETAQQN